MPDIATVIVWASIIATVITAIVVTTIIRRYKTKLKSPIYPIDRYARLDLNAWRDDFIGSTVTRVRVSSSKKR